MHHKLMDASSESGEEGEDKAKMLGPCEEFKNDSLLPGRNQSTAFASQKNFADLLKKCSHENPPDKSHETDLA